MNTPCRLLAVSLLAALLSFTQVARADAQSADTAPHVRLAALANRVLASGADAMPQLKEALTADDATLSAFAIESLRRLRTPQARAALQEALPKISDSNQVILLGTVAELGDDEALQNLRSLAVAANNPHRGEAQRELNRLQYAAPASVLAKLGEELQPPDEAVQVLTSAYAPEAIQKRRAELATKLAPGEKLLAYLDCGVMAEVKGASGVAVRQLNGESWVFAGADRVAAPPLGTVAYHSGEVRFEISGLDPHQRYALGFTWWDYDNGGRVQSVTLGSGQPAQSKTILPNTPLPNYTAKKFIPTAAKLPVPPEFAAGGKVRVAFKKIAGPNAVVSELWLIETQGTNSIPPGAIAAIMAPKPVAVPAAPASGTKVLIVTGVDYPAHKWQETAPAIKSLLERDTRLKVGIVEDPSALGTMKLKEWDVVLLHFQNWEQPGPGEAARNNLKQFVANGGGLVSVHFACGAWHGEWPEFQNILGRVWHGSGPGKPQHDARGPFLIEIADKEHPVTRGLADFTTTDELYTCLTGDAPIHLLAHAKSKVDKTYHPQAFVREYGQGRVFLTTLGHDLLAYTNNPGVGELLRRGTAWAAGVSAQPAN
jgi:type 1 glutamine amidotransferase